MSCSWYTLERYALGECADDERRTVEEALLRDPEARAILDAIRGDQRALPALSPPPGNRSPNRMGLWGVGMLVAALCLIAVGLWRSEHNALRGEGERFKGGMSSLELVRMRGESQTSAPDIVAPGDRLGLRLTCPDGPIDVDIVVFHLDQIAFPFARDRIDCGNRVPLPGAFSVDAPGELTVCASLGELPSRAQMAADRAVLDLCIEVEVRK